MNYSDYQNQTSSEKITLAIVEASKRLMGWTVHSGSVYKITNFDYSLISAIEDSGTTYVAVSSLGSVTAGKYYHDKDAQIVYLRTSASDNPNSRFLACTLKFFFSNVPVALPFDLDSGEEVFFEPIIATTSNFGSEIDTINQTSEAIEGSGSLSLQNDYEFWPSNFDKLNFENQRCQIFSYNRSLPVTEAQKLFDGKIETKSYSQSKISLKLKDQLAELRAPMSIPLVSSLGARTSTDIANNLVRSIFGRVYGHIPINTDQELEGYPLTGTISVSYNSTTVTGSGTQFLTELSPDDTIVIDGVEYTVATVDTNTSLTISDVYADALGASALAITVKSDQPKRWINRTFKVANHALREPLTTTLTGSNISQLILDDASDIFEGDVIYIGALGSGETAVVESVTGSKIVKLTTTLATAPGAGVVIRRPAIQNVRIDDTFLEYYRDYTFDATTAVLTLRDTAEANACSIRQTATTFTFVNGSRSVTCSANIEATVKPGYMVGVVGNADFFEVLDVHDTTITLRTASTFSASALGRYKELVYDHGKTILSLECLGRTDDGTSNGNLLRTAPSICKTLLTDAGLGWSIDTASFALAEDLASQDVGLVVPTKSSDTKAPAYRDVINLLNKSVFGNLVQTVGFAFGYQVLQPRKTSPSARFSEADLLSFSLDATAENAVKTCVVQYQPREYDYTTGTESVKTSQQTSNNATYLLKTVRVQTFTSYLVESKDAAISANRWSFLLETSAGKLTLTTKLQGAKIEIGSIIEVEHEKFFERYGSSGKRKLLLVESVKKNGSNVLIEAVDLSNAFNRVACINENSNEYTDATEDEKLYGGYITDQYGLINDDPNSFGVNLIW